MVLGLRKSKPNQVSKTRVEWPDVNTLVWVRLPCCETAIHPSRSEDYNDGDLVLAAPIKPHPGRVPAPESDKAFSLGWRCGPAAKQVRVKFVEVSEHPVPTWRVEAVSDVQTIQNRRYVRTTWDAPAEFQLHNKATPIEGRIVNISEGGLRCVVPAREEPRFGYFTVSFDLERRPTRFDVEIAWWGTPAEETVQVGLSFVGLDKVTADRIRRHVFALQADSRRRQIEAEEPV